MMTGHLRGYAFGKREEHLGLFPAHGGGAFDEIVDGIAKFCPLCFRHDCCLYTTT
jgi:hypothetical protein